MMPDMTSLTVTEGNDQFYPTPDAVAGKMLASIEWDMIENVLEPSAGKGNLVLATIKAHKSYVRRDHKLNVDCIEIDPYLRAILKENYASEWVRPLRERKAQLDEFERKGYDQDVRTELREVENRINMIQSSNVNIIHDNFLTFHGNREYQLIIMNPPFSDGDLHLLRAIEIQKDGGAIICLLNAETLRNPFTNSRKVLKRELDRCSAQVTFLKDAFRNAERRADVEVAIVRVNIPRRTEYHSDIWERMEKAAREDQPEDAEVTDLVAGDDIEQGITRFRVEVAASKELIYQYYALRPYICDDLDPKGYNYPILALSVRKDKYNDTYVNMDRYLHEVRLKYWNALFRNEKFVGKLTSEIRKKYLEKVESMADYDFTLFNIRTVMHEMNAQVIDGVQEAIISLFDKLTAEHSYFPETKNTIHYYDGWKSNKAHKIGKKSIIPTWGMFSTHSWNKDAFEVNTAYKTLSDIEKVFDYLSGKMTDEHDILERLQIANNNGQTKNIPLKYFDVDLYKKGTTHIKYRDMDFVDKMNIYAGRNKNWLPPNYGTSTYAEMTSEEKDVVDSFQGAAAYAKVLARKDYYLAEPIRSVTMITDGRID